MVAVVTLFVAMVTLLLWQPYKLCTNKGMLIYTTIARRHTIITKYGSTLYIGMDKDFQHHAHTFEKSDLNFHFQVILLLKGSYGQHTCVPKIW